MNKNNYVLTSQDMLDLGLAINRIAMRLDDENLGKIKDKLEQIEAILSKASCGVAYEKGRANAIDEYSSKLWQVIERATINCKLDFTIDDLRNLEIIIKGLAEELKEQNINE